MSWRTSGGVERLYRSPLASLDAVHPVRGGIPVCFPQFSELGPLPMHGFARTSWWTIDPHQSSSSESVTLRLVDDDRSRSLWPHSFALTLAISCDDQVLTVVLGVSNPGKRPLVCTIGLHTYVAIGAASMLEGLAGLSYLESGDATLQRTDCADRLVAAKPLDRVYRDQALTVSVANSDAVPAGLTIAQRGFPDTVIWNPGDGSARFADLPDDAAGAMVCIEAVAYAPLTIPPGEQWTGSQILSAL